MRFCTLSSCSYANSVVVQDHNTCILVDCGLRKRDIKPFLDTVGLTPSDIDAVLVTHCHVDHSYGLNYLLAEKDIPVYSTTGVLRELSIGYAFKKTPNLVALHQERAETINTIKVTPFKLSHDVETIGFLLSDGRETLGYLTDTGFVPERCLAAFQSVNYLYIESNHDVQMYQSSRKPYFVKKRNLGPQGHLSNAQCREALHLMGLKECELVVLAHLSEEDNQPDIALDTARAGLGADTKLVTAPSRLPGEWSNVILQKIKTNT
ncbi:MBL fold metallo-hydrolase [Desulforamulus aeronauticus]|uniref:Phosphoribosyl 1,2-cyclic phosphodiesterase n=1 Tax=Desulforamulus aeronauticus DSM 10349 TaxID=1121421 RepID=A0A1M6QSV7_9FIRM|nr:MBL fold metallo-hydrolase [Desulforamulus aeronauticus]SHK23245.1 Phosphoribosyl 1,2-cyclic phosphodiesterase [Desulforamulus aeronauticus DSM 10349]